jgi:chromosomal replication initiation ATPase DnaA
MMILDKLDEESLRQKTVITVPFVKTVLKNLDDKFLR